jgi:hypothetical protein
VWPDDVDEILGGDLAAGVAYATPAKGVVIAPMAPLGLRDREARTVTVTTSRGLWKKIDRIRRNPSVAIAYHARDHGDTTRPDFVLVQGTATIPEQPDRAWLEEHGSQMEHFLGPRKDGGLWGRWLKVYNWDRVPIEIAVRRVVRWPDHRYAREPEVFGEPLPDEPPAPQSPPGKGTGPRVDYGKVAADARRLPHTVVGWIGADGLPVVVSASVSVADGALALDVARGRLPPGGRRAGLTSHRFEPRMVGQEQRIHTGWLEVDGDEARYAPHTKAGYRLPTSQLVFNIAAGAGTRLGRRAGRKAGVLR